jgi:hypothetical protein
MRRAVAIAILIPLLGAARADIYRSVDAQGHVQYSDTPSPGAELVYSGEPRSAASSSASESNKLPSWAQRSEQISHSISSQAAARDVERDTQDAHSKQCQQARQTYQQSISARRLYKLGEDGERQYMSDDEAGEQRVKYKLAMDTACEGISDQTSGDTQGNNGSRASSSVPAP